MVVEFIIDKKDYQNYIKNISLKASNELVITKKNKKAKGKDNFYLTLFISESSIEAAQALSEVYERVNKVLKERNVKFYVLTNEASKLFVKELYPLACEFETTLRKFIYCALFDINEKATDDIVEKINKTIGNKEGNTFKSVPNYDLLSNATFEQIFNILFSNDDFFSFAKNTVNQIVNTYNRRFTKEILIKEIEKIEENTIWNKIFAEKFGDSILPKIYESLINFRNDIMHFHYIGYQTYQEAFDTFQKGIDDLNSQINKQIVIEATKENVTNLSNNSNYINMVASKDLSDTVASLVSSYKSMQSRLSEISSQLAMLTKPSIPAPTLDILDSLRFPTIPKPTLDILNSLRFPTISDPISDIADSLRVPTISDPISDIADSLRVPTIPDPVSDIADSLKVPSSSVKFPKIISPVSELEDAISLSKTDKSKNVGLSSIQIKPTKDNKK